MNGASNSAVRRFYEILEGFSGAEELDYNLRHACDDYQNMVGPPKSRFCEWAYTRLEERSLIERLLDGVIRASDTRRISKRVGLTGPEMEDVSPQVRLRESLRAIGIREPQVPDGVEDGIAELREFRASFEWVEAGCTEDVEGRDQSPEGKATAARRGAERLLKLMTRFLWDVGCQDVIADTVEKNLEGFRCDDIEVDDDGEWIADCELGTLNYLLHAADKVRRDRGRDLRFLRDTDQYWSEAIHGCFNGFAGSLQMEVHEKGATQEERRRAQKGSVSSLLEALENDDIVRVPQPVRFFRRFEDGLGTHYEGFTAAPEAKRIKFYEMSDDLELHRTYLFLSATNPSALDAACTELDEVFTRPL